MSPVRMVVEGPGRIRITGELTMGTVAGVVKGAGRILWGRGDLVLDFADVQRMDSAGLALLLEWLRMARKAGITVQFAHLPVGVAAIAEICGLTPILEAASVPADPGSP